MRMSIIVAALGALIIFASSALAAFCPTCASAMRDDQRFCDDCSAKIAAERQEAFTEEEIVEQMRQNREAYRKSLEELRDYYRRRGDYGNYEKVVNEMQDFELARQYFYQHWEETIGDLKPSRRIREAELLYEQAERMRRSINPFGIRRRQLQTIDLYRQILQNYSDSELVDEAAFRLGQVYEEMGGPEMDRAARFYERSFMWNPQTPLPARFRAARIHDERLRNFDDAIRLYRLASQSEADENLRREAAIRLEQLERMKAAGEL